MFFKAPSLTLTGAFKPRTKHLLQVTLVFLIASLMSACQNPSTRTVMLSMPVIVDGRQVTITTEAGVSVTKALSDNGIVLGDLDRTIPAKDAALTSVLTITVTRVEHNLETQEEEIPFTTNILPNETMALGERQIIQTGLNGLEEVIYQHVIENGSEISSSIISRTVVREPQNEIIMEGVQSPNVPVTLNGKIAYLTSGNAWLMNGSTINRQPLVTTGDLDWRIFEFSPDGSWLLFSRKPGKNQTDIINSLWVINTVDPEAKPIDLGIINVVHFAGWLSGEARAIVCSTAEMRPTAPGWQANNDLQIIRFTEDGGVFAPVKWLEPNSGGVYGWWGDSFLFQPPGKDITILRPDGIDLLPFGKGKGMKLADILAFQTHGSWSWVTQASWNVDGSILYAVTHRDDGSSSPEASTHFDLDVFFMADKTRRTLREDVGMFAYPSFSPQYDNGSKLAYLQASFPQESETSPYRLIVMDIDGSDEREIFPREGAEGMLPQVVQWQPVGSDSSQQLIAVVYLGNLWLVDVTTGTLQQITGDGLTEKITWK